MSASSALWLVGVLICARGEIACAHDMDFVLEHLPEVAMDNRFLTLPLVYPDAALQDGWDWQLQGGFEGISSGQLSLDGPSVALGARHGLGSRWSLIGLGFLDTLSFSGGEEVRPLAPRFSNAIPLDLPADAIFRNTGGHLRHVGAGLAGTFHPRNAAYALTLGVIYDRAELRHLAADYELISGASSGAVGVVDYSASYPFWIPFAAVSWRLQRGHWSLAPRFTAGLPLPRRGWRGSMTGTGFSVAGATDDIGNGVHMGDGFGGFGLGIGYVPWHLSFDVGAMANQALGEPFLHKGIDTVWLLSVSWDQALMP